MSKKKDRASKKPADPGQKESQPSMPSAFGGIKASLPFRPEELELFNQIHTPFGGPTEEERQMLIAEALMYENWLAHKEAMLARMRAKRGAQ